jgi:hypothetical protein
VNIRNSVVLAAVGAALAGGLGLAPTAAAAQAMPSASQSCWYGGTHTTTGGRMQYYECRRNYQGRIQSSIKMRVEDTRTDGYCVRGDGRIGNSPRTAGLRLRVTDCSTGTWTSWRISGWWNGLQAYEYVYRVR